LRSLAEGREGKAALPALKLSDLVASFCNLRAAASSTACVLSPETIVARALSIDAGFTAWRTALPAYLLYEVISLSDPDPAAHASYYYTWPNLGFAVLHVSSWMTLILLHGLIIQQIEVSKAGESDELNEHFEDYEAQMQQSTGYILSLIDHICASVRYYLSLCSTNSPLTPTSGTEPSSIPCAASINAILKPLFVAGDSSLCPLSTRAWIVAQLRNIGTRMGVRQALYLAETIAAAHLSATPRTSGIMHRNLSRVPPGSLLEVQPLHPENSPHRSHAQCHGSILKPR